MKYLLMLLVLVLIPAVCLAEDYRIGRGDQLNVTVWGEEALSGDSLVRPDGKITIPALGEIVAAGKTPAQLQEDIGEALKRLLKYSPPVSAAVVGINTGKAFVFGGGVEHGVHELESDTTLLELLCTLANTDQADLENAYVLRDNRRIKKNFSPLFKEGNTIHDIMLQPGDKIFIPPLKSRHVFVLGEVNEPKAIEYREGMSVLEAILEAGGFTTYANENDTKVIRMKDGKQTEVPVKAKDLLRKGDLFHNITMQAGDYVIVSKSLF